MAVLGIEQLRVEILNTITQNTDNDITGQIMQDRLQDIIDSLNQGLYNDTIPYKAGQVVSFDTPKERQMYQCLLDTAPGQSPTGSPSNWALLYLLRSEPISRDIYLSNTGNDTTGDGTISNRWATINKALDSILTIVDGVDVTIYLEAGTYNLTNADRALISSLRMNNAKVKFVAETTTLVKSGYTLATRSGEPLRYDVTDTGNTWTENQYRDLLATDGSSFYPISYNSAGTDTMVIDFLHHNKAGATEIRSYDVTIHNSDNTSSFLEFVASCASNSEIEFELIRFTSTTGASMDFTNLSNIYMSCKFEIPEFEIRSSYFSFSNCLFVSTDTGLYCIFNNNQDGGVNDFNRIYVRATSKSYSIYNQRATANYFDAVVESLYGINSLEGQFNACRVLKAYNADTAIYNSGRNGKVLGNLDSTLMVYGTSNVFNIVDKFGTNITFDNYFDGDSANIFRFTSEISFLQPNKDYIIDIPVSWPEESSDVRFTINNNTAGHIQVGDTRFNKNVVVEYYFERGSLNGYGVISLSSNAGTELDRDESWKDDHLVAFAKEINGNEIRLTYDDTATPDGNNTVIIYSITRKMNIQ